MRVLIFTFGTRGDVQPFAALAARLTAAGHTAVLAAPEPYRADVSGHVGFEPMATEMDRVMRAGMARLGGPAQAVTLARQMADGMRASLREQWDIARNVEPTLIIGHPKALGGLHVAERAGVPFIASLPIPFLTPTRAFPVPFMARRLSGSLNRSTYHFNRFTAVAYGGMINTFRADVLGLPRMRRTTDYLTNATGEAVPVLYPFSPHVVPVPADYPASAHVTGYWFTERDADWQPPADLVHFLDGSRPVVYIGFGSMGFGARSKDRGHLVAEAVRRLGARAVVSTGWGALSIDRTEDLYPVDDVPHDWLFPRVDAVVHHGGSGTTAAGLRAGRPTLICPVLGDQPFWGRRVHELGLGPRPLPLRRATPDALGRRMLELISDPDHIVRAREIADLISHEDGAGRAIEVLERIEHSRV